MFPEHATAAVWKRRLRKQATEDKLQSPHVSDGSQ